MRFFKKIVVVLFVALHVAGLMGMGAQVAAPDKPGDPVVLHEEQEAEDIDVGPETVRVTPKEVDLLARAVYSEARGEPFHGQVAIAAVILNRVKHEDFPTVVAEVIFQPAAFTAVQDGQFWLTPDSTAYAAVEEALAGNDPSGGAIYYYNPVTATSSWIYSRPIITAIGKHVFAV